ncbi:hypothetical protein GQ37_009510 [Janthinobacterium sp. BJB1]|nr:hypothetical protein CSQ90_02525 [Janthinobacterium sp. BJB303]PJC99428.1 hypothetical protein GQ37_009510 [Janthinobacterium sp. BJB1]
MLALSASAWSAAAVSETGKLPDADARVVIDENISLNNNPGWETPDVPYARLLADTSPAQAAPPWSSARRATLAPARAGASAPAQQNSVPAAVPEASMYSMLLVGLGLLAFSVHGEKQEKFDG